MHLISLKRGLSAIALAGMLVLSGETAFAADAEDYRVPTENYGIQIENGEYLDMGFANIEEENFLYIRSEAKRESEWLGKLYKDDAVEIMGPIEEWTKVKSGEVTGYVKTEFLLIGNKAQDKAEELILTASILGTETLMPERTVFHYAEPKSPETKAREEREEREEREAAEALAEANKLTGQKVVDFASQFIGNPYVWGGTSLTRGADCSGFVQAVYANFGISMPRTSGQMRNVGKAVRFEEAEPGDVFCYSGHVGIYVGDGKIVNAIDSAHGIGISSATYAHIITIRRLV